ncbi:MAG: hypothetical protein MHM6MM_000058 [Cercozoa sp. M6MM]
MSALDALVRDIDQLTLHPHEDSPEPVALNVSGIGQALKEGRFRRVIVMSGAGISTSCGIPDFRSPGTGLYDNLQKYNLPEPEDVFDIEYFRESPEAFCSLAKELMPGNFRPSLTHYFVRLLEKKGVLLRHFTQNIDTLGLEAGISRSSTVQAHGSFDSASCSQCGTKHKVSNVRKKIKKGHVPRCKKSKCGAPVKFDIVFFGENLPERFHQMSAADLPKADLLLVMGTSLKVHPFAGLVDKVPDDCIRVLLNREPVHFADKSDRLFGGYDKRFRFFCGENNHRDVFLPGNCDDSALQLAEAAGWLDDFRAILRKHEPTLLESLEARLAAQADATGRKQAVPAPTPIKEISFNLKEVDTLNERASSSDLQSSSSSQATGAE